MKHEFKTLIIVLNLIINGIPSIQNTVIKPEAYDTSFKPYYKWNTFNTIVEVTKPDGTVVVLNLIINGIPSIQGKNKCKLAIAKPVLNLIINGIPSILGEFDVKDLNMVMF